MCVYNLREIARGRLLVRIPNHYRNLEAMDSYLNKNRSLLKVQRICLRQRHGSLGSTVSGTRGPSIRGFFVGRVLRVSFVVSTTGYCCLRSRT